MKKYEQIEHTGDIGVIIHGKNLEQLFEHAAYALCAHIADIRLVKPIFRQYLEITGADMEEVLINWLSELNYLFHVEYLLFSEFRLLELSNTSLKAYISGEKYDIRKHHLLNEIKAVTFHGLRIEKSKEGYWSARVIFDI